MSSHAPDSNPKQGVRSVEEAVIPYMYSPYTELTLMIQHDLNTGKLLADIAVEPTEAAYDLDFGYPDNLGQEFEEQAQKILQRSASFQKEDPVLHLLDLDNGDSTDPLEALLSDPRPEDAYEASLRAFATADNGSQNLTTLSPADVYAFAEAMRQEGVVDEAFVQKTLHSLIKSTAFHHLASTAVEAHNASFNTLPQSVQDTLAERAVFLEQLALHGINADVAKASETLPALMEKQSPIFYLLEKAAAITKPLLPMDDLLPDTHSRSLAESITTGIYSNLEEVRFADTIQPRSLRPEDVQADRQNPEARGL